MLLHIKKVFPIVFHLFSTEIIFSKKNTLATLFTNYFVSRSNTMPSSDAFYDERLVNSLAY